MANTVLKQCILLMVYYTLFIKNLVKNIDNVLYIMYNKSIIHPIYLQVIITIVIICITFTT